MDSDDLLNELNEFIDESREHLATIETDLLAIEKGGADIDEQLVNKVFRAAHSIKGGSGFFGLDKVKELAHKAETVLDLLRSRQMFPSAEVTNLLLAAFDKLREMINDAAGSHQVHIADLVASLTHLAESDLALDRKATFFPAPPVVVDDPVTIPEPGAIPAVPPHVVPSVEKKNHYRRD